MKFPFPLTTARCLALGAVLLTTASCSVSEQVKESANGGTGKASNQNEQRENQAYGQMQFRLNFMDEARLGGQDILFVRNAADLTSPQQAKLQAALQAGTLPLKLRMRSFARNPSKETLQLKQLDYQVLLDGKELAGGVTGTGTELEPSAIVTLPVAVDLNVPRERTAGSTPAAFAVGLADFTGRGRRLTLRVRPTYASASGRVSPAADFQDLELVTAKK